jgi:hypothetical protein
MDYFLTVNGSTFFAFIATMDANHDVILDSADGKSGLWRYWKAILINIKPALTVLDFYFAVPDNHIKQFSMMKPSFKWNQSKNESKEKNILRPTLHEKKEFEKLINCYIIAISIETSIERSQRSEKKNNAEKNFEENSDEDFDEEEEKFSKNKIDDTSIIEKKITATVEQKKRKEEKEIGEKKRKSNRT